MLAKFNLNVNSTYVTYVLTGIIVVVAVLMDVIKNKNAGKVKVETEKDKAKRIRKQLIEAKEEEIDVVLASKMENGEKKAKLIELEKELAAL